MELEHSELVELAKKRLGIENGDVPLEFLRGLGRTTIIGRRPSGLPITAEGVLVAEHTANQQYDKQEDLKEVA